MGDSRSLLLCTAPALAISSSQARWQALNNKRFACRHGNNDRGQILESTDCPHLTCILQRISLNIVSPGRKRVRRLVIIF